VQDPSDAYTLAGLDDGRRDSGIKEKRRSGECECVLHVGVDAVKHECSRTALVLQSLNYICVWTDLGESNHLHF
jgi:hypothetical protein